MRRLWLFACAILAGCTSYQPHPIDPAQLAQRFDDRSLTSDALHSYLERQLGHPVGPWPLPGWDSGMLTLAARYNAPSLALARAQWDTAKAGIDAAGARPNPVLQFQFESDTSHGGALTTGPSLDIPIETAGKRRHRIDQASYLSDAARLNLDNEAWKLRSEVRRAMLDIFASTGRARAFGAKTEQQAQIVAMLRRRESLGEAAGPDASRAQVLLGQAQAELAGAQLAEGEARARLAKTTGLPLAVIDNAPLDFAEFERTGALPPSASERRAAIFQRADLLACLAQYEATQAALQLEIAKQYPDIHIGAGYTYDAGANKISLGLAGVALPLFDRNQGAIAQAEARRTAAAAAFTALQDAIIIELDHSVARYRDSMAALRTAGASMAAAQRQLDSQTARFAAGAIDRLARTQAQIDFQGSAVDQLNALAAVQLAAGMLEDAMQRPLATDMAQVQ